MTENLREDRLSGIAQSTRRQFLLAAGAGAAGVAAAACGFGQQAPTKSTTKSKKIGFAMSTFAVVRYTAFDFPTFKKTVSSLGYEPVVNEADDDPAKQVTNV